MRLFPTFSNAVREIHRDLYKAPKVKSSRVQHLLGDFTTGEASPYSYAVAASGMPFEPGDLIADACGSGLEWWRNQAPATLTDWLSAELYARFKVVPDVYDRRTESLHPELAPMLEGNHYGYTYAERTVGMLDIMANQLIDAPDTRRCFWPIFHPMDAIRAVHPTRVPCTIGYQAQIRPGPREKPMFEFTIISRSCDYEKFWASDLWFAYRIGYALWGRMGDPDMTYGNVYHHILSFHRFIEDSEETY